MAAIEIGPLTYRLQDDEIGDLTRELDKVGVKVPPATDDGTHVTIADGIDRDVLDEFFDRLEAEDIACDIYLPAEFDERVEVGDVRVGSAALLLEVLAEIKDDLDVEEEEEEEEEEDEDDEDDEDEDEDEDDEDYRDMQMITAQLKKLWKAFYLGAEAAMDKRLPMYVTGE